MKSRPAYSNRPSGDSCGSIRTDARLSKGMSLEYVGRILLIERHALSRYESVSGPAFGDFRFAKCVLYDLWLGLYLISDVAH